MKNTLTTAFKGMAMGIAEVIPGVSGGTIAFITGIYERLINAIKAFGPSLISDYKNDGFGGVWKAIDGLFLVKLMVGMLTGVVVGVFGVTYILEHHPVLLWSFFFGLIIASAIYIGKQVTSWKGAEIVTLIIGVVVAYAITVLAPANGNEALWFVFLSGAIAISALILPGISGSFILLLMGMYTFIVDKTVKHFLETFDLSVLPTFLAFGFGALFGLMTFSRVLSWTFKNYHNPTMALLTGFMIGSLNKIWPWRVPVQGLDEEGNIVQYIKGVELDKVIEEANLLPAEYLEQVGNPNVFLAIVVAIIGFVSVFLLERLGKK